VDYQKLISRFLAGEISDNEITLLKTWLEIDHENRSIFNQENELWQESSIKTKLDPYKSHEAWNDISVSLGIGNNSSHRIIILKKNYYRILLVAASIAFLIAFAGISLWISEKSISLQNRNSSTLVKTYDGEKSHIFLSDSSRVILNVGSTLQYNGNYNRKDRTVKLTGEAFFDVHTNPGKPFIVQVGLMTVTATGTRFNVLSYNNENRVEITLEKGIIQVSVKGQNTIHVKAGQQVVFYKESKKTLVRDVDTETYTSWIENKLRFNDTSFEEVMSRLSRNYNVEIYISNTKLLDLNYTATFIDESIEDIMQMLASVSPITYRIYNRTTAEDTQYQKPKIIIGLKQNVIINNPKSK
jgi:ferric-dicitrate binding protein FerR (iron transport regulator)